MVTRLIIKLAGGIFLFLPPFPHLFPFCITHRGLVWTRPYIFWCTFLSPSNPALWPLTHVLMILRTFPSIIYFLESISHGVDTLLGLLIFPLLSHFFSLSCVACGNTRSHSSVGGTSLTCSGWKGHVGSFIIEAAAENSAFIDLCK